MKYCFTFVCQAGELEIKASILAASLAGKLECRHELIAAIPGPSDVWGEVDERTLHFLRRMGVTLAAIRNPISRDYPVGNKLACLDLAPGDSDKIVFLDSDILCLGDFAHEPRFRAPLNVKPADTDTSGLSPREWSEVYELVGARTKRAKVMASTSQHLINPYFNAGFIALNGGIELGATWRECALRIDEEKILTGRQRFHLDQVALAAAVARLGLRFDCLDERYNYPAHMRPLRGGHLPLFCHYHRPQVIQRSPPLLSAIDALLERNPGLRPIIDAHEDWKPLLTRRPRHARSRWFGPRRGGAEASRTLGELPDGIITGIPRSGTSLLCSLMHRFENVVAVNEPREIFGALQNEHNPWALAVFYEELRRKINLGLPIENKWFEGMVIDDTAQRDERVSYSPEVTRQDFALVTKNTLAYVTRIPQLRKALPHCRIFACVRHPADAIASWKSSFAHLRQANFQKIPMGRLDDPHLTALQRRALADLGEQTDPSLKRALWWRFLASLILDQDERVTIVRYEDVVTGAARIVRSLIAAMRPGFRIRNRSPLPHLKLKRRTDELKPMELDHINAVCGEMAVELGYDVGFAG